MLEDCDPLFLEFKHFAFATLLREFSSQVDRISEQQASNKISWDEAVSEIGILIQQLKLKANQVGLQLERGSDSISPLN